MKKNSSTLARYFLSYFVLLCLLMTGFYGVMRSRLYDAYAENLTEVINKRMNVIEEQFDDELQSLEKMFYQIRQGSAMIQFRYDESNWNRYLLGKELGKFSAVNSFIDSIIYLNLDSGTVLSSSRMVNYRDDVLTLYSTSKVDVRSVSFALSDCQVGNSQLVYGEESDLSFFLYFPGDAFNENTIIFYVISTMELEEMLKNNMSGDMEWFALVDRTGNVIAETGSPNNFLPENIDLTQSAVLDVTNHEKIAVQTGFFSEYSLVALFGDNTMEAQFEIAFYKAWIMLVILGILGTGVILMSMNMTYIPLSRLTKKIIDLPDGKQDYLHQLDQAFLTERQERAALQKRIDGHRLQMQKLILDSIFSQQNMENEKVDIERFFDDDMDMCLYVLDIQAPQEGMNLQKVADFLEESLPGTRNCAVLEQTRDHAIFLINYTGQERNKDEVICNLMNDLHENSGYLCAVSNSGTSALEIPALYENAVLAAGLLDETPVVFYSECRGELSKREKEGFQYPYHFMEEIGLDLKYLDLDGAGKKIAKMLEQLMEMQNAGTELPEFYVRSILLDILTDVINAMNRNSISFEIYQDLYLETLFYCRSCAWEDSMDKIHLNLEQLLWVFGEQLKNTTIHRSQIVLLMEKNYDSPDFSISALADEFGVSIAYMSYTFKKKFQVNFSEYLWDLRLKKAQELLQDTDLTVDQISVRVGYLNPSSFRRKFKTETGETPSQFRVGVRAVEKDALKQINRV